MLWKQLNPRYRKLLKDGQQGEAVVVAAKADRTSRGLGLFGWNVTIRVKLPDGSVKELERYIEAGHVDASFVHPGHTVPIRFDPNKPSRVEIDTGALHAHRDAQLSRQHAEDDAAVRKAEARLGITDTQPPDAPRLSDRRP